jgi:hypothetical protein
MLHHPRSVAFIAAASTFALAIAFAACGSGGSGGSGGSTTSETGGAGGADCGECFRAIYCVTACGEEPVQAGCCPCPEGTFDDIVCEADAGSDGG